MPRLRPIPPSKDFSSADAPARQIYRSAMPLAALILGLTQGCSGTTTPTPSAQANIDELPSAGRATQERGILDPMQDDPALLARDKEAYTQDLLRFGENNDAIKLGEPAPDFALPDLDRNTAGLASLRGKTVVLEWFNPDCPFVKYAHTYGPLKEMANVAAKDDKQQIVWLAINSNGPGSQGSEPERNRQARVQMNLKQTVLLDENGSIGKKYGARSSPHFFVIDPDGKLVYQGALDNAPLGRVVGQGPHANYVASALSDLANGRPVANPDTMPYGCGVKFVR